MAGYRQDNRRTRAEVYPYIRGNVVPKPAYEPPKKEKRRVSEQVLQNRERQASITGAQMVFMTLACIAVVAICVVYLNLHSQINVQSREITRLEQEVAQAREENDTRYNRIHESVNLEEVRTRAEALGMVTASESQIQIYTVPNDDYITQRSAMIQD